MKNAEKNFEPRIIAFLCNWCSYAGADLAGVSRIQYPENIRIIRVMCSGRVDPRLVLEAFRRGADGVMCLGCHPGDCHYISGNYLAKSKLKYLKESLEKIGFQPERFRLDWVSATEGKRFATLVEEMVQTVKKLGPNPIKGRDQNE